MTMCSVQCLHMVIWICSGCGSASGSGLSGDGIVKGNGRGIPICDLFKT